MAQLVEVKNITPVNKNSLLATCSVRIVPWKITFHEVSIFQKGQQRWINMPARKWEKDGEVKYMEQVSFDDDDMKKRFHHQVMSAVDTFLQANPNMEPEPAFKEDDEVPF